MVNSVVGAGVDRYTGRPVNGFEHVENSIACIFETAFGTRVIREWFGSYIPTILGRENVTPPTFVKFYSAVYAALLWEPRFELTQVRLISSPEELRFGGASFLLEGIYMPRAHLGDYTSSGPRRIRLVFDGQSTRAQAI